MIFGGYQAFKRYCANHLFAVLKFSAFQFIKKEKKHKVKFDLVNSGNSWIRNYGNPNIETGKIFLNLFNGPQSPKPS